jgi:hypothetical protein
MDFVPSLLVGGHRRSLHLVCVQTNLSANYGSVSTHSAPLPVPSRSAS